MNCYMFMELGVFGGLITPVCSYILSESVLCHSTVVRHCVLYCVEDSNPYQLVAQQSVVGSNPTQGTSSSLKRKKCPG